MILRKEKENNFNWQQLHTYISLNNDSTNNQKERGLVQSFSFDSLNNDRTINKKERKLIQSYFRKENLIYEMKYHCNFLTQEQNKFSLSNNYEREEIYKILYNDNLRNNYYPQHQNLLNENLSKRNYKIVKYLQSGGQADVYEGYIQNNQGEQEECVFKIYQNATESEFQNEISILKSLPPINIVKMIDYFLVGNLFILVLEKSNYCLRQELKILQKKQQEFTIEKFFKITIDPLTSLYFLKMNNIIHNDIKPGNILLTKQGNYVFTDFYTSFNLKKNDSRELIGCTKKYASPEILQHSKTIDFQSDIYSLGKTFLNVIDVFEQYYKGDEKNRDCDLKIVNNFKNIIVNQMVQQDISNRSDLLELIQQFFNAAKFYKNKKFFLDYIKKLQFAVNFYSQCDDNKQLIDNYLEVLESFYLSFSENKISLKYPLYSHDTSKQQDSFQQQDKNPDTPENLDTPDLLDSLNTPYQITQKVDDLQNLINNQQEQNNNIMCYVQFQVRPSSPQKKKQTASFDFSMQSTYQSNNQLFEQQQQNFQYQNQQSDNQQHKFELNEIQGHSSVKRIDPICQISPNQKSISGLDCLYQDQALDYFQNNSPIDQLSSQQFSEQFDVDYQQQCNNRNLQQTQQYNFQNCQINQQNDTSLLISDQDLYQQQYFQNSATISEEQQLSNIYKQQQYKNLNQHSSINTQFLSQQNYLQSSENNSKETNDTDNTINKQSIPKSFSSSNQISLLQQPQQIQPSTVLDKISTIQSDDGDDDVESNDINDHLQQIQIENNKLFDKIKDEFYTYEGYEKIIRFLIDKVDGVLFMDDSQIIQYFIKYLNQFDEYKQDVQRIRKKIKKYYKKNKVHYEIYPRSDIIQQKLIEVSEIVNKDMRRFEKNKLKKFQCICGEQYINQSGISKHVKVHQYGKETIKKMKDKLHQYDKETRKKMKDKLIVNTWIYQLETSDLLGRNSGQIMNIEQQPND